MTRRAFTLVELMIVVAIIGILAAIAIPNFVGMQYRAKRAELPPNIAGIRTAEIAYEAAYDELVDASAYPTSAPGKLAVDWVESSSGGFKTLGWMPTGKVRGQYSVATVSAKDFKVMGICDIDGDGTMATYTATKSINTTFVGTDVSIY